jgi:hypothetical protein
MKSVQRPAPAKDLVIFLGGAAWGLSALIYQALHGWFAYPVGYGLNVTSLVWVAWSLPAVIGIIFGPFALSLLVLHRWKSPFFAQEETEVLREKPQ